jgi:alkylation response protein AidB-like acyl-CoA dehydrogenase
MDFDLSPDQRALQAAARTWFQQSWSPGTLRAVLDGSPLPDLRASLAEVGFLGILQDGGTVLDLALVAEEAGRSVAPTPLIGTAARSVLLLREVPRGQALLQAAVTGRTAVAVLDGDFLLVDGVVSGRCDLALDLGAAASFLLLAQGPDGPTLLAVGRGAGVELLVREQLDASRDLGGLVLQQALGTVLHTGPGVQALWDRARLVASVVLSAEDLGTLERALELTVAYAQERQTFGRSIGSYQAVKHACVDTYVEQELLRSLVWLAAWTADADPTSLALHAAAARALASSALERATDSLIQIHGGIGFTWEHDAHLLWRRARVDRFLLGELSQHRDTVATLALASIGA